MEHYFTEKENIKSNKLSITGEEAHHLLHVLRKKAGEEIYVTDGERNLYKTVIDKTAKNKLECTIIESYYNVNEPVKEVTLYQGLLKNPARFEFVIEKATELGVYEIIPIVTENVVNKKTDKTGRWQSIALAAMKQSLRCYLPKVLRPVNFTDAVRNVNEESVNLIADERERGYMLHVPGYTFSQESVSIFIGPEGGFTPQEVELAVDSGFHILNLGKRKLRSETAGILAVGLIINS